TSGREETGRNFTATSPTRTSAIISSEVATGLNTNRREMFMPRAPTRIRSARVVRALNGSSGFPRGAGTRGRRSRRRWRSARRGRAGRRRRRSTDLGAVAQAVRAVDDHGVADRETRCDRGILAVARTQRYLAHRHRVAGGIDEVDIVAGRAGQDRRRWNEHGIVQRVDQDLDVDELARKERLVVV